MEQKKWNRNDRRPPLRRAQEPSEAAENMLEGRNAVQEALAAGRPIDKLYIAAGETDRALARLAAMAKQAGAAVVETDRRKLDQLSATGAHQGVVAVVAAHAYATVDDILDSAAESREKRPLIVLCDELSDPHNLGAIIRTAECAGAHGVIIPKRRSVGLTAVVGKASAGALEYMPVARVSNLVSTIRDAARRRASGSSAPRPTAIPRLYTADLKGPAAIVIGNEGEGMSRLVSEACDFKVSIPMHGRISSLNASNAAAILLYEAVTAERVTEESCVVRTQCLPLIGEALDVRSPKASPSREVARRSRDGEVEPDLRQPLSLLRRQRPYHLCPFGTFPP